jgi:hypothetical protein|tara:strand:- start:13337 stop:14134 length:798 start_codon:yes stop_codon:yes gene_type:complete
MKVMIQANMGRIGDGIASSLVHIPQFQVSAWSPSAKPIMDMFDEMKPNLVIASSEMLKDKAFPIASQRYPETRIVSIGIPQDDTTRPHLVISNNVCSEYPSLVFEGGVMIGKIGRPSVVEKLKSDVLCITDYVEGTEEQRGIVEFLCSAYNIKIFGNSNFPVPNYLGIADDQTKANALASTKVYVDLDGESHNDALWLKKNSVSKFKNILDLKKQIDALLNVGDQEINKIKVKNKTYFDLCSDLLKFFGVQDAAKYLIEKKGQLL